MHDWLGMIPEEAKQTFRIHGGNLHQMHVNQRKSLLSSKHILHERGVKKMLTQVSNTSWMFNTIMEETKCRWWAQQQLIRISISLDFHHYVNNVIVLVRPKDVMVYARGTTTSKTTLWISLVLTWFDDSPHSNQGLDKMIDSTTDHEEQSMKISSLFNTHTQGYPFGMNWVGQAFIFQLSKLLFSLTN